MKLEVTRIVEKTVKTIETQYAFVDIPDPTCNIIAQGRRTMNC